MKASLKLIIRKRAKYCCEYCVAQEMFAPDPFSDEHIVPRAKDGTDDAENLALACQRCNNLKHTFTHSIDPATGDSAPLYNPRKDDWNTHFHWDETFSYIVGDTSTGRATIERLQLNRQSLINLRRVFTPLGLHPPF